MTPDPVSWLLIEPGWQVVDSGGGEIGKVEEVTGDSNADIFDGLAVATGMLARPKYVPAEQVGAITDGTVQLTLDRSAFDSLGDYEEPADSIEIEGEKSSLGERLEAKAIHEDPREHRETLVRRISTWLGLAGRR
ncbi:MAG TPA: hypothetical protein VLJ44_11295 [Gaiellaceae bacterium]|nr:hypothetical protein [Gaiellaceae bacterium]